MTLAPMKSAVRSGASYPGLPVTSGLYSNYRLSSAVAVLYGIHLTVIAGLNAWLWWLARKSTWHEVAGAIFPVLIFVPGTAIARCQMPLLSLTTNA